MEVYTSESAMAQGIKKWERLGWRVSSTTELKQGWDAANTCCLGCLFLPLALLGKKDSHYQVTFEKTLRTEYEIKYNLRSNTKKPYNAMSLRELASLLATIEHDLEDLESDLENPPALKVSAELKALRYNVSNTMWNMKVDDILKRNGSDESQELHLSSESEIKRQLDSIERDMTSLKDAPQIDRVLEARRRLNKFRGQYKSHYDTLVEKRVKSTLENLPIQKPFSNDEPIIVKQLESINNDLRIIEMAPKVSALEQKVLEIRIIKNELQDHLVSLLTTRIINSLKSNNIEEPFTNDINTIEESLKSLQEDISTLQLHPDVPALSKLLSKKKDTEKALQKHHKLLKLKRVFIKGDKEI